MKSKVVERIMAKMPLETELKVSTEMTMMVLLSELGYREDKMWGPDEMDKLIKLNEIAEKLTQRHLEHIDKWIKDGNRPFYSESKRKKIEKNEVQ